MRGLQRIPSVEQLADAYGELMRATVGVVDTPRIALWSQWARFDPRLAEILAGWLARNWRSVDAFDLNGEILTNPWPAALGVILEQVGALLIPRGEERRGYRLWQRAALHGVTRAPYEIFFIGTMAPGGKLMRKAAEAPLRFFLKWGYFGADLFVNKTSPSTRRTTVPREQRASILWSLFKEERRITVAAYRRALGGGVSLRQAELDLKNAKGVQAHGNTRARTYTKRGA